MRTLRAFLGDVASHWVALMSGLIGVALAAVAATGRFDASIQNKWFWIVGALCVFVAMFQAWRRAYRARLSAESQVALATRNAEEARTGPLTEMAAHLADLRNKLGTSSPDEIKAQIDGLQKQVAELVARSDRGLSRDDIVKMAAVLSKSSGFLRVALASDSGDAYGYGHYFGKVIQRAGWKTDARMPYVSFGRSPHGLCLVVPDPASLTPAQVSIAAALDAVGLSFGWEALAWTNLPGSPKGADPNPPDAILVISRPLSD